MKIKGNFVGAGFALSLLLGGTVYANAATYQAESNNLVVGVQFESTSDIGGGQNATGIDPNDAIQWNINVAQAGNYKLTSRSATTAPASFEVYIDGNYTAEVGLRNTGGWTSWESIESVVFPLTAGNHTLRVRFATGNQKLNWVQLDQTSAVNQAEAFTTGLWRLVSRTDRTTLGRDGNSSGFVTADYLSLPHQQWRLASRGNGSYDLKLESTQTCLSRVNNAAALASCGTASSSWKFELLRARSVDRPAIYRFRSPQNTCLRPPVSPSTEPTVAACNTNARWYLETAGYGERTAPTEFQVSGLLIVKPVTNMTVPQHNIVAQGTVPQSIVEASQEAFKNRVRYWLERITDGRVTWTGDSVVAHEPIRSMDYATGPNLWWRNYVTGQYMLWNTSIQSFEPVPSVVGGSEIAFLPFPAHIPNDVQRFVPKGVYDSVQVFFEGGTVPGGWGYSPWGAAFSPQSNYTTWTTIHGGKTPAEQWLSFTTSEPTQVFIHEMMHGLDDYYDSLGVLLPEEYTHGAEVNRYASSDGWIHFYRDYWLGTVIGSDDIYRGFGPRMFSLPKVHEHAQSMPESTIKITHPFSGKCLSTKNGVINAPAGTEIVFSSSCSTDASSFVLQPDGMLRHKYTGSCVHPDGGTAYSGVKLVLWPSCTSHVDLPVEINDDGNIRNKLTGLCVHPAGGFSAPPEGTNALYQSGCELERLRFRFNRY